MQLFHGVATVGGKFDFLQQTARFELCFFSLINATDLTIK